MDEERSTPDPLDMEYESVKYTPNVFSKIFDYYKKKEKEVSPIRNIFIGLILISIYVLLIFPETITSFAKDICNTAILQLTGIDMPLSEAAPIEFNTEAFLNGANIGFEKNAAGESLQIRHRFFGDCTSLQEMTGMVLPESEALDFTNIYVYLYDTSDKSAKFSLNAKYEGSTYYLVGKFRIADYTPDSTVISFAQGNKATSMYECTNGQKVYFVKKWGYSRQNVYFEEGGIIYMFSVNDNEESIAAAEEFAEAMVSGQNE